MGMTSNKDDIFKLTGLNIGNVYLDKIEYAPQINDERILDCATGNFHLYPALGISDDDVSLWKKYFDKEKNIFDEVKKHLSVKYGYECKIGRGTLQGIAEDYPCNFCFRYLEISKGKRKFILLLKKFYIDDDDFIHCEYGVVQFYSTLDKNGYLNEFIGKGEKEEIKLKNSKGKECTKKILIHYPRYDTNCNYKHLKLSTTENKVNMCSPEGLIIDLNFINSDNKYDLNYFVDNVVKSFKDYIDTINILSDDD
ncbi:hypothetical protein HMPREF1125_0830 [Streptococcus oralis SK304]|jgi:hypothetical protein|uniref:Uncharacterized protein n=3 Tax=Streptococcus TaxID=1301 RepID=J4UD54_STROR|nr:hypothetical protein [Streptococcus oralis]EJP20982.1 hypothetical protein HMPREF1125_0830 [Streptococcus oralis SK304]